jgi:hypothetical protein
MKLGLSLCAFVALGAGCPSDTDDRPLNFDYIHAAILKPNCATSGCHSTLTKTAGVDLQDRDSARRVVQESIASQGGEQRYKDIVSLLRGQVPQRYRMPPDQPLPEADILLFERWYFFPKSDAGQPPLPDAGPPDAPLAN